MPCGQEAVALALPVALMTLLRLRLTMNRFNLKRDQVEERAAIMEYDGGLSRQDAQEQAARAHGFKDWAAYEKETT